MLAVVARDRKYRANSGFTIASVSISRTAASGAA
jgi:hypothetical protein